MKQFARESDRLEAILDEMMQNQMLYLHDDIMDMHSQFNAALLQEAIDEETLAWIVAQLQRIANEQA